MSEREDRPDDGSYLEIWVDIPEVGEPVVRYFQSGADDEFEAWVRSLAAEDISVTRSTRPFDDLDEWVIRATDDGVGPHSYWVKLRR